MQYTTTPQHIQKTPLTPTSLRKTGGGSTNTINFLPYSLIEQWFLANNGKFDSHTHMCILHQNLHYPYNVILQYYRHA